MMTRRVVITQTIIKMNQPKTNNYDEVSWEYAKCRNADTELFYAHRDELAERGLNMRSIRAMCGRCVIRRDCLSYAMGHEKYGMWGGLTQEERTYVRHGKLTHSQMLGLLRDMAEMNISLNSIIEFIGARKKFMDRETNYREEGL
jgi:WhiB family redox-sensing transcriptional regulator